MMPQSFLNLAQFRGTVRVWNLEAPLKGVVGSNLVVYTGADIVANLLAGNANYRLARFWFEFTNGTPALPVPARTDTAASVLAGATGSKDIIRGPLVSQPLLAAATSAYNSNVGTYHAMSVGTVGEKNGLGFSGSASSQITAICLVASPVPGATITSDVLYARWALPAALAVGSSGQIAASWITEAL